MSEELPCFGVWLKGSGGHAVFSHDCETPAAWTDGDWHFCDRHLPHDSNGNPHPSLFPLTCLRCGQPAGYGIAAGLGDVPVIDCPACYRLANPKKASVWRRLLAFFKEML